MRKPAILFALAFAAVSNAFAAITGTVIDPDGKPIAGATIRAYAAENSAAMRARLLAGKIDREPLATAQSSDTGAFSLDVKGATAVDVAVESPGRHRVTTPTVDGEDLGAIALASPPAHTLHITAGGKAVANAIVLSGADAWRTNASGDVPIAATNAVFVVHPDYAVMRRDAGSALDVKLTPGVAVRGRVVNAAGPVPHALVSINGWPLAESGDDGTFAIAHAPESWQSITAARGNDVGMAARSKAASVEIRLAPGGSFTGTLRDTKRGVAVGGARMTLNGGDDVSMTAVTDAKGNFSFAPLLPRAYQIGGMHPAFAIESASVTLPATKTRSFVAQQFAQAKGRVIDEEKKPVGAAMVTALGNAGARGRTSLTNAAGEFVVRIVPAPSAIPVTAAKRDYVNGSSAPRIWQPGETRNDLVITLAKGFVAQVKVIDKQRQPVPNAQVNVTRSAEGGRQRAVMIACADPSKPDCHRTGADGIVSVRTTEGRHDLMVVGDDIAPVRSPNQQLTARAPQIVITVDRGVEISGRVVHADGTPVVGAIVDAPTAVMQRTATSAADGSFTIAGVASGSSVLTAHTVDGNLTSAPVTVNAPARDVTITMPQGARIEGRITDRATQQPVTDFTVLLPRRGNPRPNDFANAGSPIHADDGHYALENVTPGAIEILVRATGYVPGSRSDINAEDGKTVSNIDIQLDRGTTVSGRVTSSGAPVAGVQVRQGFQRSPAFGNATTDADGFYSLDGVAEGDRTIEFQKSGYIVLHKPITVTAGKDVHLDAELDHGRELRGRVVDRTGAGMPSVFVTANTPGQQGMGNTTATTDSDGSFLIQGLVDGKYKVVARKEGLVSAEADNVDLPQSRALTLTMDAGATINGRVTGLPPEQLTQVIVTASGGTSRNQTYVDAGGNFSLTGLPDGRVRLDAFLTSASNRRMAPTKTITIENGVAPPVELNFDEGITVSGHVTKGGTAVAGGSIAFVPVRPASPGAATGSMIAPDGTYTASGLAPGDYNVRVSGAGVAYQTKYTVAGSGTFDIDIHGATLRGRVVDATSGAGLANARVNAVSRVAGSGQALTDSDGRFVIEALGDSSYDLSVNREQYATVKQQVVVTNGAVPDVEVRMEPAGAVTIHLLDATSGAPIDGNVTITDPSSKAFMGQAEKVDTGTFKAWLKPGTYQAGGFASGYIFKAQSFTTPADVNLALVRGGTLLIRARTAQTVRLDRPGGGTQRALGELHPGANCPYESIPPGNYIVATVGSDGKVQMSVPVVINAGETASVDLP